MELPTGKSQRIEQVGNERDHYLYTRARIRVLLRSLRSLKAVYFAEDEVGRALANAERANVDLDRALERKLHPQRFS